MKFQAQSPTRVKQVLTDEQRELMLQPALRKSETTKQRYPLSVAAFQREQGILRHESHEYLSQPVSTAAKGLVDERSLFVKQRRGRQQEEKVAVKQPVIKKKGNILIIKKELIVRQLSRSPRSFNGRYNKESHLVTETDFEEPLKTNESPKH